MVSSLGPTGLTIDSLPTLVANLTAALQGIYGADINVASNSPDGQMINTYCQLAEDQLELIQSVCNTFGFMQAYGVLLDQRVAIMGIARKQGTFTTTPVVVTVNQALTLYGLDQTAQPVFTLIDQTGNTWELVTTQVFSGAGSMTLTFQSVTIGAINATANTITQQVTTVLGVTSVNNPITTSTVIGVPEETDTQLKVRAIQSFSLAAIGPADAIEAALLATPDITDAMVVENYTGATVAGTPAHSIWAIVTGGTGAEIGQCIYAKKAPGCGMRGAQSQVIMRPNGTTFTALWDTSIAQPLFIKFGILWRGPVTLSNATIIAQLAAALTYKLGVTPSVGDIITAMATIAPTAIVIFGSNQGVSEDGVSYGSTATPTTQQYYFTVSPTNIVIT
jgi:uncharacterized phage protein gp47/JayE